MSTEVKQARELAAKEGAAANIDVHDGVVVEEAEVAKNSMTALDVLLSAKPVRQQRTLVIRERDGLPQDFKVTIRSLTDREFKSIGEEAEVSQRGNREQRRAAGKAAEKETDNNMFLRLIVATAIAEPNFNDPSVLQAHQAISGEMVVQRVFLPGEIAKIAEEVMDLSGWSDDAVEVAGNL